MEVQGLNLVILVGGVEKSPLLGVVGPEMDEADKMYAVGFSSVDTYNNLIIVDGHLWRL